MLRKILAISLLLGLSMSLFGCYTTSDYAHNLHHDMVKWRNYEGIHGDVDWITAADHPSTLRRDFAR
ncbi:MAG: hypothetical protein AMS15_07625 [Planctomycetes bacterium DG_23]|nr:MAG: hypothetical protein AMS15_07625 [Planctomycetes bacterium DG_23]